VDRGRVSASFRIADDFAVGVHQIVHGLQQCTRNAVTKL
jgi:hypothetical protein